MANINSYLTFNGNCLEAMTFYKECLGGELTFQTVGELALPLNEPMPPCMENCVVHATLIKGDMILTASDMVPENGLIKGNSVSLLLSCNTEDEAREYYTRLSTNGEATHPLEDTFWGALFGDLVDKYGNQWLINFENTR
ncbi:VOC family protein [Mucilaginibacter sp. HC2]|uniref:VOC family protein n=1 Tax=Mucilaginibacter inviolabilis TaxID=2714892 RepID=UPI00140B98AC|nr:VOC family protein [Mucilaginibacter inviolabilis]NHA06390.1 VOC family protein [Mucilaginibacter inviolabilis]